MLTIYTKSAALRLIPQAKLVEAVRVFPNCIQVTYRVANGGRCSTLLSKKKFVVDSQQMRLNGANDADVIEVHGGEYVVNSKSGNHYVVRPSHEDPRQRCECGDCHYRAIKCKHQVTVEKFQSSIENSSVVTAETIPLSPVVTKEIAFAAGFGWMPVKRNLSPLEIYYSTQRVQIWKLASKYWGTYGHLWVVDNAAGAVVAIIQANSAGCWESADIKRDSYIKLVAA